MTFSINSILKTAWVSYKQNFKVILPVLLVFLIADIVILIYNLDVTNISSLYLFFLQLTIYYIYKTRKQELEPTQFNILNKKVHTDITFGKMIKFILTDILALILLVILYLLLVIPGIIFTVYWILTPFVVFDKDLGYLKALKYSKKLVEGQWWKIFLLLLISFLPFLFNLLIVYILGDSLFVLIPMDIYSLLLSAYFVQVFLTIYLTLEQTKSNSITPLS